MDGYKTHDHLFVGGGVVSPFDFGWDTDFF